MLLRVIVIQLYLEVDVACSCRDKSNMSWKLCMPFHGTHSKFVYINCRNKKNVTLRAFLVCCVTLV